MYICILGSGYVTQDDFFFLMGDSREMVSSRYSRADALKLTKTGSVHKTTQVQARCAPTLNKKLPTTDTHWQKEYQFSPMACHWVYPPHPRAGSVPGTVGQHRMNLVIFLWSFCFILLCNFFVL